jgi:hypothetical protein
LMSKTYISCDKRLSATVEEAIKGSTSTAVDSLDSCSCCDTSAYFQRSGFLLKADETGILTSCLKTIARHRPI